MAAQEPPDPRGVNRRDFLEGASAMAALLAIETRPGLARLAALSSPKDDVIAQIAAQHEQTLKILREWIALPSIAAENRGYPQGAD
jgi:hypothetical protein